MCSNIAAINFLLLCYSTSNKRNTKCWSRKYDIVYYHQQRYQLKAIVYGSTTSVDDFWIRYECDQRYDVIVYGHFSESSCRIQSRCYIRFHLFFRGATSTIKGVSNHPNLARGVSCYLEKTSLPPTFPYFLYGWEMILGNLNNNKNTNKGKRDRRKLLSLDFIIVATYGFIFKI